MPNNYEEIGNRIKRSRKEKKITQKQLGEILGVSEAMISQYERGLRNPKLDNLKKISNALEISIDYFLEPHSILSQAARHAAELVSEFDNPMIASVHNVNNMLDSTGSDRESVLIEKYLKLNNTGKDEAIKRVSELTEIERYTNADTTNED